jgi:SSS family transporter
VITRAGVREADGTWEVDFAPKDGQWAVTNIEVPSPEFGTANYAVLIVYLLAMLGIGWWTSRFIKDTRGFFIAEGRLNHIVVGISILTAYLSALTMMAIPGVAFRKLDWLFVIQLPFLIFTAFVITQFVLKRYRDAGVISVYQYLEQRIHVSSRLLASFSFILFSIGRMGLVLYLPALAFSMVTGSDLLTTIIIMGVVVTIYTVMGGMEAVIWTDFVQAIIMVAGAVVSAIFILVKSGGGRFMDIATAHHKFRIIQAHGDWTSILTVFLILETIYQTIRIYGTQQDITQRYMTTRSTKKANASVWIAILGFIPFCLLFFFIGTALFVYFQLTPDPAVPAMVAKGKADAIYPYFVASRLPAGVAGLVIAAIFAAAMSSIDACMNASSTVCVEDFYRRFRKSPVSERHYLFVARGLTVVWGVLATVMAILMMNIRTVQIVWGKVMGISTNGVLGLMALAFLRRPVRWWAAIAGFASGYAALFTVMWFLQVKPSVALTYPVKSGHALNYLLWPVIGNTICFVVGLALDRAVPREAA